MATTALTAPTAKVATGVTATALATSGTAANDTMTVPNDGRVVLLVFVGSAGTGTLTVSHNDGSADDVITIANSTTLILGPFNPAVVNDNSGLMTIAFSVKTGNSVKALVLPANARSGAVHNPFAVLGSLGETAKDS